MLEFSDAAYRFFEAKPSAPLIRFGRELNRRIFLPGKNHRIAELVIDGEIEEMRDSQKDGGRLMFVINHPTHSDAQVITETHRRLGVGSCFMAAYDVFLRSRLSAWSMQKMGHFSIDREGSDRKAMAAAIEVLKKGERALNIFPEGNVFLTNDRLAPFLDGAAFIALKAQSALEEAPVRIIPISLKYTHLTTPREAVTARMNELGKQSNYTFPVGSTSDPVSAVMGLGRHIIANYLRAHGHGHNIAESGDTDSPLYDILGDFAGKLVDGLENSLEVSSLENAELSDRILKIRSRLHQLRTDPSSALNPALDGMADKAILALRIHGYLSPYVTERPTIDRYDETVERIAEDFYSRAMPRTGPRRAMVKIHSAIDVREFSEMKLRDALPILTEKVRHSVQSGIDDLIRSNDAPGAAMVTEK